MSQKAFVSRKQWEHEADRLMIVRWSFTVKRWTRGKAKPAKFVPLSSVSFSPFATGIQLRSNYVPTSGITWMNFRNYQIIKSQSSSLAQLCYNWSCSECLRKVKLYLPLVAMSRELQNVPITRSFAFEWDDPTTPECRTRLQGKHTDYRQLFHLFVASLHFASWTIPSYLD